MIFWTLAFLLLSVVFACFAYRKDNNAMTYIAKLLFFISLFCFMFLLVSTSLVSGPPPIREPAPISLRMSPHLFVPELKDNLMFSSIDEVKVWNV